MVIFVRCGGITSDEFCSKFTIVSAGGDVTVNRAVNCF